MLMPLTVAGSAAFPALSRQLPVLVTDCPAPSALSVWPATVFVAIPDGALPASAQLKFTVTLVLFHPAALGAGERLPVMTGLVLSIWMVRVLGASWFPALSVAKYVRMVLPSTVMATTALLPATTFPPVEAPLSVKLRFFPPEPPALSVAVSVTVTLALFH